MRYALFIVLPLLAGCTHYEFDILQPPDLARHVGRKAHTAAEFDRPPLHYHLQAVEGRLVMDVANPNDDPVELLGGQTFVVDPAGQSHPVPSQAIGPHSFIRLVLPPMRPGYWAAPGYAVYRGGGWWDYGGAVWVAVPAGPPELYWRWHDETMAKVHLVYKRGDETIVQEFLFGRRKM
jgi:hypothetical protein